MATDFDFEILATMLQGIVHDAGMIGARSAYTSLLTIGANRVPQFSSMSKLMNSCRWVVAITMQRY